LITVSVRGASGSAGSYAVSALITVSVRGPTGSSSSYTVSGLITVSVIFFDYSVPLIVSSIMITFLIETSMVKSVLGRRTAVVFTSVPIVVFPSI